ncbi:MAG TPA: hypothetical protein DCY12_06365 [Candidatus Atribacteria bacterium]|jgi:hypothetical protein|nr:hypothetical protein [Candidatus Atribacteria bacterium]
MESQKENSVTCGYGKQSNLSYPKIFRESGWRYFITDNFQALGERIHLFEGKQYFMILLFQIKFFKIKIKASPEDWITAKQHIQSEDQEKQQGLDPRCFLPTLTDFLEPVISLPKGSD